MMSREPVRLVLVGAGAMARNHLDALRLVGGIEVVGLTSRTRSRAESLAEEYGIPSVADDIEALAGRTGADALLVAVSADQMHAAGLRALALGLPVLLEKPPALRVEDAEELLGVASSRGARTMVAFNRRFYSVFHKGLAVVREHGRLLGVHVEGHERFWRVRDSDAYSSRVKDAWLMANGTHTVDLLRFFAGEPVTACTAAASLHEAGGDQFAGTFEFPDGTLGHYEAHWYSPGGWRAVLYGEGVTVEFKPLEHGEWTDTSFERHAIEPDEVDLVAKPGLVRQAEAFERLVREGVLEWPAQDLMGAVATMRLAERLGAGVREVGG